MWRARGDDQRRTSVSDLRSFHNDAAGRVIHFKFAYYDKTRRWSATTAVRKGRFSTGVLIEGFNKNPGRQSRRRAIMRYPKGHR